MIPSLLCLPLLVSVGKICASTLRTEYSPEWRRGGWRQRGLCAERAMQYLSQIERVFMSFWERPVGQDGLYGTAYIEPYAPALGPRGSRSHGCHTWAAACHPGTLGSSI